MAAPPSSVPPTRPLLEFRKDALRVYPFGAKMKVCRTCPYTRSLRGLLQDLDSGMLSPEVHKLLRGGEAEAVGEGDSSRWNEGALVVDVRMHMFFSYCVGVRT